MASKVILEESTGQQLTPFERETIIRWDETDDQHVDFYTTSKRVADRLIKAGVNPTKEDDQSWWFMLPKKSVRIKPGKRSIHIAGKISG